MFTTNIDRHLGYRVAAEIDPRTYRHTATAEGVDHAFRFTDTAQNQLRVITERALDSVSRVSIESVDIRPGFIQGSIHLSPTRGRRQAPAPKRLMAALSTVAPTFNEQHATPTEDGDGYLDGFYLGERYIEAVRPEDAPTPEEWATATCEPSEADTAPDPSDAPIAVIETGEPTAWDAEADRHVPITAILPIEPETYHPVKGSDTPDAETAAFRWAAADVDRFREHVETGGRWGGDFRLEIHPSHIRVDTLSRSLSHTPTAFILGDLEQVVGRFNQRRRVIEESGGRALRRPELQVGDVVYIGAASTEGRAAEWIDARDLRAVDGTPPAPDPKPERDADDNAEERTGLLGRLSDQS